MPKRKVEEKTHSSPDEYFAQLASVTEEARNANSWMDDDYSGQLAVDVFQTEKHIVIRAAIAGVRAEDIDISVNNDMVTIKGVRRLAEYVPPADYLYQECYWGGFSRSIILPVEIDGVKVKATIKNGILRVVLPKIERPDAPPISVIDEDEGEE